MKKIILSLLLILPAVLFAQNSTADSLGIKKACADYVEGFYTSDTMRVSRAVHPELAKRIINTRANYSIQNMGASSLIATAANFKKPEDKHPEEPFNIKVIIYDIAAGNATAKIITNKLNFFDYAQLAKINGEWKIINVLWAFNP